MLTIILVRHAETTGNEEMRAQGSRSDLELSPRGREQAERLGRALQAEKPAAIYSSPLVRALETARAIARHHNLEVHVEPDLREVDYGDVDGKPLTEVKSREPECWNNWTNGDCAVAMPGGESLHDVQVRAWRVWERVAGNHPDGSVVVVGHVFTNLTLVCAALGLPPSYFRRMRQGLACINRLCNHPTGWRLITLNDRCHLED